MKQVKEKAFRIKMMHNELPTLDNMIKRFPKKYKDLTECIYCRQEEESLVHLLSCTHTIKLRKEIWNETRDQISSRWLKTIHKKEVQNKHKTLLKLLEKWYRNKFSSGKDIIDLCLGLFQKEDIMEWTQSLREVKIETEKAKQLLNKFSRTICKQVRKKIWNDRCIRLQDSGRKPKTHRLGDRDDNGTRKGRKKKSKGKGKEVQEVTATMTYETSQNTNIEESSLSQVQNKISIWEWIKEGKKWLGL
jgi:hypothetical protein